MDRRGFLGTLLASLAATTIDPASLLWRPPSVSEGLSALQPEALVSLQAITRQMHREILRHWQGRDVVSGRLVGQDGLTRQLYVMAEMPSVVDQYGVDCERFVKPAALALAQRLQEARATRTGTLPLNLPGAQSAAVASADLSVRGICQWDMEYDKHLLRFDVVCG